MIDQLQELGLSKNEATIYLFLLKHPAVTTGPIIKETKIANSRVYESLQSLIDQGIVSYSIQKDGKHFHANDPAIFTQKAQHTVQKAQQLVPQLQQQIQHEQYDHVSKVYEGYDGFKTAFSNIIDTCPRGETIFIVGFSMPQHAPESLRTFITNQNLKSVQKKHNLHILIDQTAKYTLGQDREQEANTTVRYMPPGFISPAAMDIFQDYVYIFLWDKKPYVYMIKNKGIAESFKNYFLSLWNIAEK